MRPSLTRRLANLYTAMILVVLMLTAVSVWFMMRRALLGAMDDALLAEARALAGCVELNHGRFEFELGSETSARSGASDAHVLILDDRGGAVFASSTWVETSFLAKFAGSGFLEDSPGWVTTQILPDETPFRAVRYALRIHAEDEPVNPSGDGNSREACVLVARSLDPVQATLAPLAAVLGIAVAGSLCLSVLIGRAVARRGAAPVRELADSMSQVNPANPEWNLANDRVPIELAPIADTTRALLARVREELDRRRRLTTDIAHDLRTPVAGVRALLDVCIQRPRTSAEYEEAIEQSRAALRELSRLLDDVLTLSRLEAGVDRPGFQRVQLDEVVIAAAATVQPLATSRNVRLAASGTDGMELRTDPPRLVKILSNLFSNAIEHSPSGSTIGLSVERNRASLFIAVTDAGPGVPPHLRDRIFDRFVRGDDARTRADGHCGLGLPIAEGLARLLGGTIRLDEAYTPGSRFVVRLPLE